MMAAKPTMRPSSSCRGTNSKEEACRFQAKRDFIRACQELPGQELFQYIDEAGELRDVTSSDVNAYLKEISGEDITAKDFRTWHGTVLAAMALNEF